MQTSDSRPYGPARRIYTLHSACQITFSLSAKDEGCSTRAAFSYVKSLGVLKYELVAKIRKKTTEATIDVFQQDGQGCSYKFRVMCRFKNPMHPYVASRIFARSIEMQKAFHISPTTRIKVCPTPLDAVRQSYALQPPEKGERWLHHSLLCSKAHDMPLSEFVEELGKTVKREESNLLGCFSWEQYRKHAWAMQALLYCIHEVLLTKCNSSSSLAQGMGLNVGTAAVAVPPRRHPSKAEISCLPSNAESSAQRDEPDGALNSTDTIDHTADTSPRDHDQIRRKLSFTGTLRPDALAPVETPEHRERPSGDSQAEALPAVAAGAAGSGGGGGGGGGPGTALGACVLSDFRRKPEAELHFEAGAEPERHKRKKRRAGRMHQRRNCGSSLQTRAESPSASLDSSRGSTLEKELPDRVGPTSASTTQAVESVPVANFVNKAKRQRDSSPARVPAMISGLTISDFGDLARDYKAELERKSNAYSADLQDPCKSIAERKYEGKASSGGGVSNWTINHRRECLKEERQQYQNRAAAQHCEAVHLRINNPFTMKACGSGCECIPPSAGDFLSRADL